MSYLFCLTKKDAQGVIYCEGRSMTVQSMLQYQCFPIRPWQAVVGSSNAHRCTSFCPKVVKHGSIDATVSGSSVHPVASEEGEDHRKRGLGKVPRDRTRTFVGGQADNSMNVMVCHSVWIYILMAIYRKGQEDSDSDDAAV